MKANNHFLQHFIRHKVAANLLMMIMLLAGVWGLMNLNVQFLPSFKIERISVDIAWPGATAEDIENSIINPVEKELRNIDDLKELESTARPGYANINLEFMPGANMSEAIEQVREHVNRVRDLPSLAEKPIIQQVEPYELVAKVLIYGPDDLSELRPLIYRFEQELLDKGLAKIRITGLPRQEIRIEVPMAQLFDLKLSLSEIAQRINRASLDTPAGIVGRDEVGRQLRSIQQKRSISEFEQLDILHDNSGQLVRLGNIAHISQHARVQEAKVYYDDQPAIELQIMRGEDDNALVAAQQLQQWLDNTQAILGDQVQLHVHTEMWILIKERINLLLKNGSSGLLLIIIILMLSLNRHIAFWIVVGIPTSFMAALGVLYATGGSINMVSLFAIIMTLGIIVDDTIVVGEQTLTNLQNNQKAIDAVESAVKKMFAPIMSSSLTTICAFFPLFFITGTIGKILFAIPLVVVCVIIASIIECFFVLPGHLVHSFRRNNVYAKASEQFQERDKFKQFERRYFRPIMLWAIQHRGATLVSAFGLFAISLTLVIAGYINFTFFPQVEGRLINANVRFVAGTPEKQVYEFADHLQQQLYVADKQLSADKSLITTATKFINYANIDNYRKNEGEQYASMVVELLSPEDRDVTNTEFMQRWQHLITTTPYVDNLTLFLPKSGPPGEDIDILFYHPDVQQIKAAANSIKQRLERFTGVSGISDDMPYSQEQLIFELNAVGQALGLTANDIGRQLRAAFNGEIAQIFYLPNEEIEVRVMLPESDRNHTATLETYPILTPNGESVPLNSVADLDYRRAPDVLRHTDTKLSARVSASVDSKINNANKILAELISKDLPQISKEYGVEFDFKGKAEEQAETLTDMRNGLFIGLTLIYIVLAWIFASYAWPVIILFTIPLGLTGAILGHWLMGIDLTILSLFGLFGLSGIVINDSIILINEYSHLKQRGVKPRRAILDATALRFRAVILTSVTTIAGLTPLLFETSLQAQFLIPMAVSITFGLAYATLLILVVVPTLLLTYEKSQLNNHRQA